MRYARLTSSVLNPCWRHLIYSKPRNGCAICPLTPGRDLRRGSMCEKCAEIERRVDRYRMMQSQVTDKQVLTGLAALIAELLKMKAELHPEQDI